MNYVFARSISEQLVAVLLKFAECLWPDIIIFAGNIYCRGSILSKARWLMNWVSFIKSSSFLSWSIIKCFDEWFGS